MAGVKASRYNWVLEHEGRMALFNGATGCLVVVEDAHRARVSDALVAAKPGDMLDRLCGTIRTRLVDGGFFVEKDRDERSMLRHVSLIPGRARALSGVTAVVTTRCNLGCRECGLKAGTGQDMAPDVVDRLVEALEKTEAAEFSISICGGEPLLAPGACVDLAGKARAACGKRGTKLAVGLSTNGYLLDKRMARRIANAGVRKVRIHLDGRGEHHDPARGQHCGAPAFAQILDNVFAAAEHMDVGVHVMPRGNREELAGQVGSLTRLFSGHDRIRVRLLPAGDQEAAGGCVGRPHLPQEAGRKRLPGCAVVNPASFILMPDGSFALCWNELGARPPAENGLLRQGGPPGSLPSWLEWDPYGAPPCSDCRRLPTCGGGCPSIWALTGRHECAFSSDEEYIRFIRANFALSE